MVKKKQEWKLGSIFKMTLSDGSFVYGQVVSIEPQALNSFLGAFFGKQFHIDPSVEELSSLIEDPVSIQFVTRDLLDDGIWPIVREAHPIDVSSHISLKELRSKGFVGVKIIGSGIIIKLFEALNGLYPWNGFAKPDYLDSLLVDPKFKPSNPVLK